MWIENGRLYDRYTGRDGKVHKVSVPLAKDTPQAHRNARKALEQKISDNLALCEEKRLNELIRVYLSQKDIKPSSRSNYDYTFDQILLILGDMRASDLSAPVIKRKLAECRKPVSAKNRYILILNAFLKWCYEYGYTDTLIHVSTEKEKKRPKDSGDLYLEPEELRNVLDEMTGTMDGYLCRFMALTGCRIGEAVALTLEDVGDRYIEITKTYDPTNHVINTPKTLTSERDVFIQPELRAMLREYYEWRRLYMMAYGIRTDKLFFSINGNYVCVQGVRNKLHKISPKLHPHIFRHTHTALLAEQGASLETIARRLGHSDSKITRAVYFHVTERMKERDERLLEGISIL